MLKVDGQHLLGHVVVVQLVVAQRHVDVQCEVLPVVQQYSLVDVNSLLIVGPRDRSSYQLTTHNN